MTRKHIFHTLDTVGDGSGVSIATGDYSSTAQAFRFKKAEPEVVKIHRMIIKVQDAGTFDANNYGNGITLTNGIRVFHRDKNDAVLEEMTAYPILSSGDWAGHCHDAVLHSFGVGDEVLSVRWTFSKTGIPLIIDLANGEYLEVLLNDNFTGLTDHKFLIQGFYTDQDL